MNRLRFARMIDEREDPAVFWMIGTPNSRIEKKIKLFQSVFEAVVIDRSIASATGIRQDFWIRMGMRYKLRSCELSFRMLSALSTQLGELIGSSRSSSRCLSREGAVDGCGKERVACSGNRLRWHSHVRRLEDSAFLRRAQARW